MIQTVRASFPSYSNEALQAKALDAVGKLYNNSEGESKWVVKEATVLESSKEIELELEMI